MNDISEKTRASYIDAGDRFSSDESLSGQSLADLSEHAALRLCVFPHNASQPGVDSSLARVFFEHLPTIASWEGAKVSDRATVLDWSRRDISRALSHDLEQGRELVEWIAPHLPKHIVSMFGKGEASSLNTVFERLAKDGGFERDDILVREAQSLQNEERAKRRSFFAAASNFLGLDR